MRHFHVPRDHAVELSRILLASFYAVRDLLVDGKPMDAVRVAEYLIGARETIDNMTVFPNLARPSDTGIGRESILLTVIKNIELLAGFLQRIQGGNETENDGDERVGRMFISIAMDIDILLATPTLRGLQ